MRGWVVCGPPDVLSCSTGWQALRVHCLALRYLTTAAAHRCALAQFHFRKNPRARHAHAHARMRTGPLKSQKHELPLSCVLCSDVRLWSVPLLALRDRLDALDPCCRSCRLVPSSIDYACRKWSRMARTDAPERAAGVLRQCHVAQRYSSAHASAGRASALGHSWCRPFLLRTKDIRKNSATVPVKWKQTLQRKAT